MQTRCKDELQLRSGLRLRLALSLQRLLVLQPLHQVAHGHGVRRFVTSARGASPRVEMGLRLLLFDEGHRDRNHRAAALDEGSGARVSSSHSGLRAALRAPRPLPKPKDQRLSREPIAMLVAAQNNHSAPCKAKFSAPRVPRTRMRWHRIEKGQPAEVSIQNDCTKTTP